MTLTKRRKIEKARFDAGDIGIVQHWFQVLEKLLRNTSPKNIYNFDETGFRIGQQKDEKVITAFPDRSAWAPTEETNEGITAIECIAANGDVIPPYFIVKGEYHLERWYKDTGLPDDYRIATSPTGWTNDS
jgi:hypothetical protein